MGSAPPLRITPGQGTDPAQPPRPMALLGIGDRSGCSVGTSLQPLYGEGLILFPLWWSSLVWCCVHGEGDTCECLLLGL